MKTLPDEVAGRPSFSRSKRRVLLIGTLVLLWLALALAMVNVQHSLAGAPQPVPGLHTAA